MARRSTAVYAAGHFLVDLACAFVLVRFVRGAADRQEAVLLYNFLAFAGQLPLGLLADRLGDGRRFAAVGCVLVAASYAAAGDPLALAVPAGIGNALYHVGGGLDTLNRAEGRAGALGVFVAPGAFGLFLGTLLAGSALPAALPAFVLLLTAAAVLLLCEPAENAPFSPSLPGAGAAILGVLFLAVVLRSYAGFLFAFPWRTGAWSWVFVLCVVLGKGLGGLLHDRIGFLPTALASLVPAAALFFLSVSPVCGCLAVLLFNGTMPLTLHAAAELLPGAKGFSFGLLTFALFLGLLPSFYGWPAVRAGWMYALLALVTLALLLPAGRRRT